MKMNLKSERGLALVKEMVKKADVFTPRTLRPVRSSGSGSATTS